MKPISTLMNPIGSVDLKTHKQVEARRERSDFCVVPACAVVGEAAVAPVLANALIEKYGGDSVEEIRRRYKPSRVR
jgi:chorismate synthase